MQIKKKSLKVKYFRDTSVLLAVSKARGRIISLYMMFMAIMVESVH